MRSKPLNESEWIRFRRYAKSRRLAGKTFDKSLMRDLQVAIEPANARDVQGLSPGLALCVLRTIGLSLEHGVIVYANTAARTLPKKCAS